MFIATQPRLPNVVIVSPALASANNGNWQTAKRYAKLLSAVCQVRIVQDWDGGQADDVLIALHARRSYASIAAWYAARGAKGLIVVLTGTDLYRDIQQDAQAQQSLVWAGKLIVLQSAGLDALPPRLRAKAQVLFQSTTTRVTLPKTTRCLRAVMVGHLRTEKSPETFFRAAALLASHRDIELRHIGGEHDLALAQQAHETAALFPQYQFLGARSHAQTRTRAGPFKCDGGGCPCDHGGHLQRRPRYCFANCRQYWDVGRGLCGVVSGRRCAGVGSHVAAIETRTRFLGQVASTVCSARPVV